MRRRAASLRKLASSLPFSPLRVCEPYRAHRSETHAPDRDRARSDREGSPTDRSTDRLAGRAKKLFDRARSIPPGRFRRFFSLLRHVHVLSLSALLPPSFSLSLSDSSLFFFFRFFVSLTFFFVSLSFVLREELWRARNFAARAARDSRYKNNGRIGGVGGGPQGQGAGGGESEWTGGSSDARAERLNER